MKEHAKVTTEQQNHRRKKRPAEPGDEAEAQVTNPAANLNQEGVTGLQQAYGNRAVGKLLAQRKQATVQRGPKDTGEFVPEIKAKPESRSVKVGNTFTEKLRVVNWQEAPHRTRFQWGGGINDEEHLKLEKLTDADATGSAQMQATVLASGETGLNATLVYQVPGGPELRTPTVNIPVTIPQPEMWISTTKIPKNPGGDPTDLTRLSKDDVVKYRISIHNYDPHNNLTTSTSSVIYPSGRIKLEGPTMVDKSTYVGNITAGTNPGPFTVNLGWEVYGGKEKPPIQYSFISSVEMDRQLFVNKVVEAIANIGAIYDGVQAWTKLLANQYGASWNAFKDTLKSAAGSESIVGEIILNAALAFIPGGLGGMTGLFMKKMGDKTYTENFLIDGVKDLVKDTLRRYPKQALPIGETPAYNALPTDPREWQNTEEARVLKEKSDVQALVRVWIHEANSNPDFITDFDPAAEVDEKLKGKNGDPASWKPPTEKDGFIFEKGWWHEWISKYGLYLLYVPTGCYSKPEPRVEDRLGRKIKKRVKYVAEQLGENGDSWMDEWTGGLRKQLEAEKEKYENER